jgi:hypothetical protein
MPKYFWGLELRRQTTAIDEEGLRFVIGSSLTAVSCFANIVDGA